MRRAALLLGVLMLGGACGPSETADRDVLSDSGEMDAGFVFEREAWKASLLEDRESKDEEFRSSATSPMAGVQYLKSEPTEKVYLIFDGESFGLSYSEESNALLRLERQEGIWRWHGQETGVVCEAGEEVVPDGSSLEEPVDFLIRGLRLAFYPSEERVTFIVFDPDRAELQSFHGLLYFPPDPDFAVSAKLSLYPEPEEVEMLTSRNLRKTFYRYARIGFRLDGREQKLSAFKYALEGEEPSTLFIPFRDASSGKETYGAGRFLEIEEPRESTFLLDFNRAFNPLCNYSPAYNCALPPTENHLEVAVLAGERTYPH